MKKLSIVGNWKNNKGIAEAQDWLRQFNVTSHKSHVTWEYTTVVLCAPFTLLYPLKQEIARLQFPLELGAQDVSPFPDGAYTGAVSARQLKELVDWVIIGHSERRRHFGETDEILFQKVARAKEAGLKIIFCVPDGKTALPTEPIEVVAYEPVWAIGSGTPDTPENANQVMGEIKKRFRSRFIYGGSVTAANVLAFLSQPAIDGVLPGGASLDPDEFSSIVAASQRLSA